MSLEKLLVNAFLHRHPDEAAKAFQKLDASALARFLADVNPQSITLSLQKTSPQTAATALSNMSADQAAGILKELPLDTQLAFIHAMKSSQCEPILGAMPDHHTQKLRRLIDYPEGSAGYLMDTLPSAVLSDCVAADAIKQIRANAETLGFYIYVTDDQHRLVGMVTLRQLYNAKGLEPVSSIMQTDVACLTSMASERDIINHPQWKDFHELPVVDRNKILIGVIRYETLGRLKAARSDRDSAHASFSVLLAMCELCWLGMTGYLDTLSSFSNPETRDSINYGDHDERQ